MFGTRDLQWSPVTHILSGLDKKYSFIQNIHSHCTISGDCIHVHTYILYEFIYVCIVIRVHKTIEQHGIGRDWGTNTWSMSRDVLAISHYRTYAVRTNIACKINPGKILATVTHTYTDHHSTVNTYLSSQYSEYILIISVQCIHTFQFLVSPLTNNTTCQNHS